MKKLLNIDGGGVRVYFSLLILNYIEEKTNKKIIDLFDYFSGVSASSIVLSGLLTNYSVKEMLTIFKELSTKIFYRSYYHMLTSGLGLFDSKYSDYNINSELQLLFAGYKLGDCKKPLNILTYDLESSKAVCFYSYNDSKEIVSKTNLELPGYDLWKVIRCSTAAPTYFQPFVLGNYNLIDGGVVTNNLSELTFVDALEHFGRDEEYIQVSIGTGCHNTKFNCSPTGLWSWSGAIVDIFFAAASSYEMISLDKISKFENLKKFHRIDIELKYEIKLDDYTSYDMMTQIFESWLQCNQEYLDMVCEDLLK